MHKRLPSPELPGGGALMPAWRCPTCKGSHVAEWVCEICGIGLKDGVDRLCAECTDYFLRGEKAWREFQALGALVHEITTVVPEPFLPPFLDMIAAGEARITARYAPIDLNLEPADIDECLKRIAR